MAVDSDPDASMLRIAADHVTTKTVDGEGRVVVGRPHAGDTVRIIEADSVIVAVEIEPADDGTDETDAAGDETAT